MDIALRFDSGSQTIDAALESGMLATDDSLQTAVLVSLFTDKLAGPSDELPATEDWRRGWWGDSLSPVPGDQIGSHLWLLFRCKQTEETRRRAEEYAIAALAWMLADKIAKAVDVQAAWQAQGVLGLALVITKPDGGTERYHYGLSLQNGELTNAL